jgi:hypothetical protein
VSVVDKMIYSVLFALRLEEVLLMGTFPVINSIATTLFKFKAGQESQTSTFCLPFLICYVLDTPISMGHDTRSLNDLYNIMAKKN